MLQNFYINLLSMQKLILFLLTHLTVQVGMQLPLRKLKIHKSAIKTAPSFLKCLKIQKFYYNPISAAGSRTTNATMEKQKLRSGEKVS